MPSHNNNTKNDCNSITYIWLNLFSPVVFILPLTGWQRGRIFFPKRSIMSKHVTFCRTKPNANDFNQWKPLCEVIISVWIHLHLPNHYCFWFYYLSDNKMAFYKKNPLWNLVPNAKPNQMQFSSLRWKTFHKVIIHVN